MAASFWRHVLAAALLALIASPAATAPASRWESVPRIADIPLSAALDLTDEVRSLEAFVELPFPVTLGDERYEAFIAGPGWIHLLTSAPAIGDPENPARARPGQPRLGPRIELFGGEMVRVAPIGRVLVAENRDFLAIRWTALASPTARGFATCELVFEPGVITAQYLHVPPGFVAERGALARPASASAYRLWDAPGDVSMPFDPEPLPFASGDPPADCIPGVGTWCDFTGSACTTNAGDPGPQGPNAPCSQRTSNLWRFYEGQFCMNCPYRFYILVECGREMHLPTWDMEGLDLEITNMVTGLEPDLRCINDTAQGLGPSRSWRNPPNCPGLPGPWWAPPLDVTNNVGPGHVSFSDSTPTNGNCRTRFDVPCSELPASGPAPTVNYGEEQTIDCYIADDLGLCGIYRVDIISGGNGWELFANCNGENTPQFDIFFDCTEAWDAYNPLPEIAIANVSATGDCWTYDIHFEVQNIGCVDEPADVPVRITSECGDVLDIIIPGPIVAHGIVPYTQPMTLSCPDGTITFTVDPDDVIPECTETSSAAACQSDEGVDTLDAEVICCPLVNAGADKTTCAGEPIALADASSQFADTFAWTDGGAGGAFTPSANVRNPTYTPPNPSAGAVLLRLTATYSGSGCSRNDTLALTVNPTPVVDAGLPQEACVGETVTVSTSAGTADQFSWNDGGSGGTFTPSSFVQNPAYANPAAGAYVLTMSGTDVASDCIGTDTVTVTFHPTPVPDSGVDRQACACEPVPLPDALGGGATSFAWSDGGAGGMFLPSASAANPTYVGSGAGIVTLALVGTNDATGCVATDYLVIELLDCPEVDAGTAEGACLGDSATLFEASGGGATEFLWTDAGAGGTFTPSPTALNPTYSNPAVGTYTLQLTATERIGDAPVLYENDFEGAIGAEWSTSATEVTPHAGRRFLGRFTNDVVTLTLTGLPAHDQLSVCFDAFILGGWEGHSPAGPGVGPDLIDVTADAMQLLHASFATGPLALQSYPEVYQDPLGVASPTHPAREGADETDTLGFGAPGDAAYRLAFTFRHSSPTLTLTFRGLNLGAPDDESWGIDDIQVSAGACRACTLSDTTTFTVHPLPVVDAGLDREACAGTPIPLDDATPGAADDHRWSDGGEGGTFTPNSRVLHPSYTNLRAGAYTLTYTGTVTATDCVASDTVEIDVNPAPLVSAGADDIGCAGDPIPIDDAFASSGTTVLWTDGGAGGAFSPAPNVLEPSYTHPTAGTYTLTLTATRIATGCTASDSSLVTVVANPSANAGADKQGCSGSPVTLGDATASAGTVLWSDGGASGSFSPSANVLHPTYTNVAGLYTLTLRVTGTASCTTDDTLQLTVHALPSVSAGADKEACVGLDVTLSDATSSADVFSWNDGGAGGIFTPSASVRNPSYRNATAGARTLTLTATSSATGCSESDALVVMVRNPTVANFAPPPSPCEDTPVCFDNTSTEGIAWTWSFGDPAGGASTQFEPCYIYSQPGTYTVTLTSSNACGSDQEQRTITVNPKPVPDFSYSTQGNRFCKDKDVDFTDLSTNSPTSWLWNFGDGTTSTQQNPTHQYAIDGIFIVSLTACNGCGCGPPVFEALEIAATCSANCEANSNQIECMGTVGVQTGNTCTDHDNFNTTSYPCAPGFSYTGENKIYDLNFPPGANFIIELTETVMEPNGYELDLMISDNCNPPNCVAWGDETVIFDDRTAANDDYWLIVDGRNGTCGPYELTVRCLSPDETAQCAPPAFDGIVAATDEDECSIPGILVTWDAVTDWGAGTTGSDCTTGHFEIWRAPVSDPTNERQIGTVPGTASSFLDVLTVPRRDYRYRVAAVNDCCGEPTLPPDTDDARDEFGNTIEIDAGTGGIVTCDAPELQLLATASGGTGAGFDWLWSPTAGLSDPTVSNPVATIGATYTLTVTDRGDGCSASDVVVVVGDNVPPAASAGPDRVVTCGATSVTLSGSASGGNASMGYSYSWTPASGVSNPASPTPTTSTPGTYTLTVEAIATGCTSTDTVLVTLSQDPPLANAGPNRELTCAEPDVTLAGSASGGDGSLGYAYSWTPASGVSDPTSPTPTTALAGAYTLTVTALASGCTDTDVVVVVSNRAAPVADAGPDRQLSCVAGPVTLEGVGSGGDGSDGYSFAWSPADAVSDPAAEEPTTSVPGTYTLTVTDNYTGCTDIDTVVVAPDPDAPAANAGPDDEITCLVGTASLTGSASGGDGSAGYSYAWSPAGQVADPTAPSTTTTTPGVYTLRVTSIADGCVGMDAMTVADLTGPPTTSAGPDVNVTCAAPGVTLEGSASDSDGRSGWSYSWSPAGPLSDPTAAQPTTSTPGTYTLTATDVFTGCFSSDSVTVGTDTAPPVANAGLDGVIRCNAPEATLTGSASGGNGSAGYSFSWSPAAGVADPIDQITTTTLPGTYTLTVTALANGCTDTDIVFVADDTTPPVANAGPDADLDCTIGSVQLTGSASGGNGSSGYTFQWEPAAAVTDADSAITDATASGTFTLTVTDVANGCTDEDTVLVTSSNGPVPDAGADGRITCDEATAPLSGSASGGDGSQGYTASWSPAADVVDPTAFVTTATAPGTYTLLVTDVATGCRAFDVVIIEDATTGPDASAGADSTISCAVPGVTLDGSASGGDGSQGYEFAWTPVAGLSDPSAATPTATVPGLYVVTVTDIATGCTATDDVLVADATIPPIASAGADQERTCAFPMATLAGSAADGDGSDGYTFAWTPAGPLSDATSPTPTTSTAGTYTLTVTDVATGCTDTDVVLVGDNLVAPTADAGPGGRITCIQPLAQLEGSVSGGDGSLGWDYSWEPAEDVSNPASATPVALAPGTYTMTVTSRANGCSDTDTVIVTDGAEPPIADAGPALLIDCNTPTVALQGSATGGDASLGYAYAWEPADEVSDPAAPSPTTSLPGIYSLTVTAVASGCTSTDSVTVGQDLAVPHANAGPNRRIDCDTPTATLSGAASGGNGSAGYSYAWSPPGSVADPTAAVTTTTVPGTYTLTVTSLANGCTDTDTMTVTQDAVAPIVNAGPDGQLDCTGDPVTLTGSASGGNGTQGYSYAWTPAGSVSSPTSPVTTTTQQGTYTLTVTDVANGCVSSDTVLVTSDTSTPTANAGPNLRIDCTASLVTLQGSASGGDGSEGYEYHWEPSALLSNADIAQPTTTTTGTYTLTVTSIASGCVESDTVVVTRDVREPTANAGPDRGIDCDTLSAMLDGSASGGNGTQGYTYSWSPAAAVSDPASPTPTTSTPGTYTLTVTTVATGCTDVDTVLVVQDVAAPAADAGLDQHLDCATTSVTLTGGASGGNGSLGYSYAWSPTAGLTDPAAATTQATAPGTYTLTVTDLANGCIDTDLVLITQDIAAPTANAGPDRVIDCTVGTVTLTGSASGGNGSAGYSYHWEPAGGVTDPDAATTQAIASGTYTLRVTDNANGCTDEDIVLVTSSQTPPVSNAGPDTSITCDDAVADLVGSASGGDGSLGYETTWSPPTGVADPSSPVTTTTMPGTYTLLVRDIATGCQSVDSVLVEDDRDAPTVGAGADRVLTCAQPTATLTGSATGGNGSAGYTFSWEPAADVSNPAAATTTTSRAGTYTLTATDDASGCSASDVVVVTEDLARPVADAGPDRPIGCTGQALLQGSASGGNGSLGYSFHWEPAALLSDPNVAQPTTTTPGNYTLRVTDVANGCTHVDQVFVSNDTTPPVADAGPTAKITCAMPQVTLLGSASGGNGSDGYGFSWEPASDVSDPGVASPTTSLPGTYTLTVTDLANACTDTDTVVITIDQAAPTANAGPDQLLDCGSPGVPLTGSASGGNGSAGYSFHWEPAGAVTDPDSASTTATAAGTFVLSVTDLANGCIDTDTVMVASSQEPPVANAGPDGILRCDRTTANLSGSASGGDGRLGYTAAWTPTAGVASPSAFVTTTTVAGTYTLTVTDVFTGCRSADTVVIVEDSRPPVVDAGPDGELNCTTTTVTLTGSASGGNGSLGYIYIWTPSGDVSDPNAATTTTAIPGTYTLTVTDRANGCSASDTVTVTSTGSSPVASAGPDAFLTCVVTIATLQGSASGGDGSLGYRYRWEPAASVSDPDIATPTTTAAATYTLTVTDVATGCTATDTVLVSIDRRIPIANAGQNGFIDCANPTAQLRGSARGGNGSLGYSFAWSPTAGVGDPTAAVTVARVPATYTLTVIDLFNGCMGTDTVVIADNGAPPLVSAGPDQLIDCDSSIVTLQGSASGGDGSQGYAYAWTPAMNVSDPTIPTPTTTRVGTYTLVVTDIATGCIVADTVRITSDFRLPVADAGPDAVLSCTQPLAPLTGSASGGNGSAGYSFAWTPAGSVADPTAAVTQASAPGTYTLTVTDLANGCRATDTVEITTDASLPVADAGPDQVISCTSSVGTLTGSASGGDGSAGYSYAWTPATEVSDPTAPTTTTTTPGAYTLTVTDIATGCQAADVVNVTTGTDPAPTEPSAGDLRPAAPPLRVRWSDPAHSLVVTTWEDVAAFEYRLYEGPLPILGGAYDHAARSCGLSAPTDSHAPFTGNVYYIAVAANCDGIESSYGRTSFGVERPDAAAASGLPCP